MTSIYNLSDREVVRVHNDLIIMKDSHGEFSFLDSKNEVMDEISIGHYRSVEPITSTTTENGMTRHIFQCNKISGQTEIKWFHFVPSSYKLAVNKEDTETNQDNHSTKKGNKKKRSSPTTEGDQPGKRRRNQPTKQFFVEYKKVLQAYNIFPSGVHALTVRKFLTCIMNGKELSESDVDIIENGGVSSQEFITHTKGFCDSYQKDQDVSDDENIEPRLEAVPTVPMASMALPAIGSNPEMPQTSTNPTSAAVIPPRPEDPNRVAETPHTSPPVIPPRPEDPNRVAETPHTSPPAAGIPPLAVFRPDDSNRVAETPHTSPPAAVIPPVVTQTENSNRVAETPHTSPPAAVIPPVVTQTENSNDLQEKTAPSKDGVSSSSGTSDSVSSDWEPK